MDSSASTQIKVGIFLSVGIVVILGSIFFLGADKALFKSYIRIHAQFEQVQGLSEGSVVSLSGVTVGNVELINFSPEKNSLDVVLKINEQYSSRLRKGSQVEIRTQGALGDKFVFVTPGDPKAAILADGDSIDVAKGTDILGVFSDRGSEAAKIFDIIHDLRKITLTMTAENRLAHILNNIESTSLNLSQTSKETQKFMSQINEKDSAEKLNKTLQKVDAILGKIDRGEGTLGALINDPAIHNQLKTLLGAPSHKNHVKSLLRTSIEKDENP